MRTIEALLGLPAIDQIGWALLHSLWQSTAVALGLAVMLRRLRRASAEVRYLAACVSLVVMATLPAATTGILWPTIGPMNDISSGAPAHRPGATGDEAGRSATVARRLFRRPFWLPPLGWSRALLPALVAAWMVGVIGLSIRLLGGWLLVRRMEHHHTRPVDDSAGVSLDRLARALRVRRRVRLLESPLANVPMVIGAFRPVILVPAAVLTGLTPGQVEALLAHELAHIRRHDYLVNLAQSVIEVLLFYHPAAWWVSRVIRDEREHCCDDLAVRACGDRLAYAHALAAMEGLRGAPYLSLAVTDGPLLRRVRRVLNPEAESMYRLPIVCPGAAVLIGSLLLAGATAQQAGSSAPKTANLRSEGRSSSAVESRRGTIYVPLFRSVSFRRDVQLQLTELVIKEIEKRTPYRVVGNFEEADTILEGTINFADKNLVVENPFNLPRQLTAKMQASVTCIHNPPLDSETKRAPTLVSGTVDFAPERGETSFFAFYRACQSLAERIVAAIELTTPPPHGPEPGTTTDVPDHDENPHNAMAAINDQDAERNFLIGDYYQRTGKVASAEYYFGKIRRRWPDSKWAAQAKRRLDVLAKLPR